MKLSDGWWSGRRAGQVGRLVVPMFNAKDFQGRRDEGRLETPATSGLRAGATASRLIGGRLGRLYNPPAEIPSEMDSLIRALDAKVAPSS